MATVDQRIRHVRGDTRSGPAAGRRHCGQDTLAEVITIRPERTHRARIVGSLVTKVRELASPRPQATSVGSTPRPPSSPAPRPLAPRSPSDAA